MKLNAFERFVERNLDKDWDIDRLATNLSITENFVKKYPIFKGKNWNKSSLQWKNTICKICQLERPLNLEYVRKNKKSIWSIDFLSSNKFINDNFVEENSDMKWNMNLLFANPSISEKFIEKNIDWNRKWNNIFNNNNRDLSMEYISKNPNISIDFIEKHSSNFFLYSAWNWNIDYLSKNPVITPEFIEKYPTFQNKKWNAFMLSQNTSITSEFIENNAINIKWDIASLCRNPSIMPEFIEKNYKKGLNWNFNFSILSSNEFTKAILEDENNHKNKILLLLGEKDEKSSLYNFKNNFLFDSNLNKLIFSYI